jgi:putative membrane protein insertion efficiency factor
MRSSSFKRLPGFLAIGLIRLYQKTRILRAPSCRFYPSCSEYMARSIDANGLMLGVIAGAIRICKCNPFHPGGVDEVAVRAGSNEWTASKTRG